MMKFNILIPIFLIILFSQFSYAEDNKIEEDENTSVINTITEQNIEEEIIKNLELLQNFNLVEDLDEIKSIAEILEGDEDEE